VKPWEVAELIDRNPENYVDTEEGRLYGVDGLVYLYITSPFGTDIYIWKNGKYTTMPYNTQPANTENVLAVVRCPGWSEIDTSVYEEESFEWDEKHKVWRDPYAGGKVVRDPVAYLIKEVGLLQEEEELLKKIAVQTKGIELKDLGVELDAETDKRKSALRRPTMKLRLILEGKDWEKEKEVELSSLEREEIENAL